MILLKEIEETLNPKKGGGMRETIMFLAVLVAIIALEVFTHEVNPQMYAVLASIAGYLVGGNHKKGSVDNG